MSGVEEIALIDALFYTFAFLGAGFSLASLLLRKGLKPAKTQQPGLKVNTCSTQEYLKVVYGKQLVGGNDIFRCATGENNKYFWVVQTLSEGECEGIETIDEVDQVFVGDKLASEFDYRVQYWFHNGSSTQTVDTNLQTAFPEWTDALRNTCYIVWKLEFDPGYFQSLPLRTVLLKGRKLYDPRDLSTAYSTNGVLALRDFMTSSLYGGNISTSKIDDTSFEDAADYFDSKGFSFNYTVTGSSGNMFDVIDDIGRHFRGDPVWFDGKYYLRYADLNEESSVMTLEDEHIIVNEDGLPNLSVHEPSRFSKPDGLRVKYIDPDLDYIENDIPIGDEIGIIQQIDFLGADREMASNLGTYTLERLKLNRKISGLFRDDCQSLESRDLITFNSTALDIADQLMRVVSSSIKPNGLVELNLEYEILSLYDDDYNVTEDQVYNVTLPDPSEEPPSVSNASITEDQYNYRGRTFTKLSIQFTKPTDYPWFDKVEVWQSYDDENWEHLFNSTNNFEITNVKEKQDYYIRLKVVSIWKRKQSDQNDYKLHHYVLGYEDAPDSLLALYALVTRGGVNLYSTKLDDTDIEVYEFRLGASWSGAIFLASLRAPNLSLSGVKPGNHTFIANTLGNNGKYGDNPVTTAVSIQDPPDDWTVQETFICDYADSSGENHDNTEHVLYTGDDYLKCSHEYDSSSQGGLNLTGVYTSPIYDVGSAGRYLAYILADIVITGAGTTWDDVAPYFDSSTGHDVTWEDIDYQNVSWVELVSLAKGPRVNIKLKYGETSPPSSEVSKMEILSAIVTGRYFQVEITITDPSDAINALVENFSLKLCQ